MEKHGISLNNQTSASDSEHRFFGVLPPMRPDPVFVGQLRDRLTESSIFHKRRENAAMMVVVLIGLLISLILFLVGRFLFKHCLQEDIQVEAVNP